MKKIPLKGKYGNGKEILIDDEDFDSLSSHSWYANHEGRPLSCINYKNTYLPRFLLNPPKNMEVDHINGDILDNRRGNLRLATRQQNERNKKPKLGRFKGISKRNDKWRALIKVDGKHVYLGTHATPDAAALAYNEGAMKYFGEFAGLNPI